MSVPIIAPSGRFHLAGPPAAARRFRRFDDEAAASEVWSFAARVASGLDSA
ncbi:hypothetical protein [Agromyces sp. Leaf222]|uniref:hypothetical protein n=1 Tax=Agromyces sp. Leaf222 TaxID=1735688 RepID=UPI000A5992BF|nr:hypothetical protein [Agromyces sp. Leaf222]